MSHFFFFFNDTATTEIYTLSLHDALPICDRPDHHGPESDAQQDRRRHRANSRERRRPADSRSEEHTSELQSHLNIVCRLLLEKKKKKKKKKTKKKKKKKKTKKKKKKNKQ